ncbi:MAG: diaminopimelate decarboxylase [Clostridiales bacterium]|nr:MAG: diaminopimelate decarboxylase [Clostridiales bacterium]
MINVRNDHLFIDECDCLELVAEHETPLYVISESEIVARCNKLKSAFLNKYDNCKALYASKAFLPMAMCKIMAREGLGLDVVSGGELYTALKAGFPTERIDFSGNNKLRSELMMAVENQIGRVVVDNLYELFLLDNVCHELQKPMAILMRIIPAVHTDTHKHISTGHKDSKFGIPIADGEIDGAIEFAQKSKWLSFKGFHFHVGSQLFSAESHLNALQSTYGLLDRLRAKMGIEIEELDVGGGFGIKYLPTDQPPALEAFIDPIMASIDNYFKSKNRPRPRIVIEPGRWIIGEAGLTLYTIGSTKRSASGKKYIAVDGGMSDNIRPALYQAKYHAVLANKAEQVPVETVSVAGKFCESGDILIEDIELPEVDSGDILAVYATGAYTYSMASNYNKNIIPGVLLINGAEQNYIVKRQSYDDIIRNEVVPEYLED